MYKHFLTNLMFAAACALLISCSRTNTAVGNSAASNVVVSTAADSAIEQPKMLDAKTQRDNLKTQAIEAGQTIKNGDYAKLADYTHPKSLEAVGGREKVVEESRRAVETLKEEGFEIISVETGEPEQLTQIEGELFSVVPWTVVLKSPNGKMQQGSSIVGVSVDNGANWKFVNGINQAKFGQMFPAAADKIKIPQDSLTPFKEK